MDYKESGVDKHKGYELVQKIRKNASSVGQEKILGGIGGFASLYALGQYRDPILVSGTDGVGTKLKLAFDFESYDSVGRDCVAMCVNDVLCSGASPLFFLDYLACDQLDVEIAAKLIAGIESACASLGIPLLGGETAEMPGFYKNGLYDLAGFCVAVVERDQIRSKEQVQNGDCIISLSSSGLHSNGFSLVRSILAKYKEITGSLNYQMELPGTTSGNITLQQALLEPTVLYPQIVQPLLTSALGEGIHAMAHITGGGLYENLPRSFNEHQTAVIYRDQIEVPEIFRVMQNPLAYFNPKQYEQQEFFITEEEMWHTFNMGVGFTLIVAADMAQDIVKACNESQLEDGSRSKANIIGHISKRQKAEEAEITFL